MISVHAAEPKLKTAKNYTYSSSAVSFLPLNFKLEQGHDPISCLWESQ